MDDAEEVVHLHVDEIAELIREPADRRALITQRTAEHERNLSLDAPRTVGRVTAGDPNAPIDRFEGGHFGLEKDGSLRGTGASAGVVRGAARIVLGADDFDKVAPGDIVVATASNPGWVPLFGIAGGIVTDTGGIVTDTGGVVSHAAVVAREFGIPAVVGTRLGTKRIRDGSTVEVDGTTGIVRLG
jgi:pyruvate,water dikinase